MQRLYQWLSERASVLLFTTEHRGASRIVRTETTLERQKTTLLVGTAAAAGFDVCPFCGSSLTSAPAQAIPPQSDRSTQTNARMEG
jgi:hypothetical protein